MNELTKIQKEQLIQYSKQFEDIDKIMVYQFLYYDTYESSYETVSLHRTALGAYAAMKKHRLNIFFQWKNSSNRFRKSFKDTCGVSWKIKKIEVED